MTEQLKQLREALRRVKYEAASLADAQVIALEALTAAQPARDEEQKLAKYLADLADRLDSITEMPTDMLEAKRYLNEFAQVLKFSASMPTQPAAQATPDVPETDFGNKATPEPVQADSSEHLRVIASLGAALRRLSFAAQTSGGTAGPDAELQAAIGQAEQALSFGGIAQAMFATATQQAAGEPVEIVDLPRGYPVIGKLGDICSIRANDVRRGDILYTHPAPGVPNVLFDGFAVLQALTPQAERRTSAENVSDVLDAAVRLIRAAQAKGADHG